MKKASGQNNVKKREAVYDKGEQVKGSATYVPKVRTNINESIAHLLWYLSMQMILITIVSIFCIYSRLWPSQR